MNTAIEEATDLTDLKIELLRVVLSRAKKLKADSKSLEDAKIKATHFKIANTPTNPYLSSIERLIWDMVWCELESERVKKDNENESTV